MVLNYLRPTTPGGRFPLYYYATSEVQGERKSEFLLEFFRAAAFTRIVSFIQCKDTKNI